MFKLIIFLRTPHIPTFNFENLFQRIQSLLKYLFPCKGCIQNKCCWAKNRHILNHYEYLPLYCMHNVLNLSVFYHAGLILSDGFMFRKQTNAIVVTSLTTGPCWQTNPLSLGFKFLLGLFSFYLGVFSLVKCIHF